MADEMVWMRFPPSGGKARFPAGAADAWAARGWEPCEAPIEPDPALVEHVPLARVAPPADPTPSTDVEIKPNRKTEK